MSEFTLPLTAEGSVTAPSGSFTFTEPAAKSETFLDVGPVNVLEIPEFGWALADGVNPLRLVTRSAVYDAGGIAPSAAPTVAGTGARATSTQTFTTNPNDGDEWKIESEGGYFITVRTVTALTTTFDVTYNYRVEVKIAATLALTIARIEDVINGDPSVVEGTDFHWRSVYLTYAEVIANLNVTVSATTATTITYRAVKYGAGPNSYATYEIVDGAGDWTITSPFSGGTNGTGTAPDAGTRRYFYTWYRAADGAETGRSPTVSFTSGADENATVGTLTASADTTFDFIRIYRTTDLGVEFYLAGAVARASTTFTDDVSDTTLARGVLWNELLHRDYTEGAPPKGRALALWKGSVWTLGAHLAADYTRGTVTATKGSAAITFSVLGVTSLMRGRTFRVSSTSEDYTLISVSESAGTAVLDRAYEGTGGAGLSFTILDDYDASRLRRSVPFLYNQWPVDESPGRVDTDDAEGGTALLATKSRLFAFSKTSIASVTGDGPESWEISKVGQGIGCVAPRMVVGVEGGGIFLSLDGFYAISPDESLACISSPKTRLKERARGIDATVARIAWANIDQGYSYYDTTERVVVFGVPLDGAVVPNYEIVFDLQNKSWATFKRAEWTAAANATLPTGGQFILTGDREGNLWHDGIGESDGFYGAEAVGTLSGAQTVRTLTVGTTPYSTSGDGEKGKPVIVLYAAGTVAYGKVASNTTSALTLAEDLDTAPAAGDQVVLGGIGWQAKSGYTTFGEEWRAKGLRSVLIRHVPSTRGEYYFSFAVDGGSFAVCPVGISIGTLSTATGKTRHFTQWPGDSHAIQIRGFKPGGRAVIRGGVFDLNIREVDRS